MRGLGAIRKRGKGTEDERGRCGELQEGVLRTTGKNLLVIKLQTDQIYIILYMYK